MKTKTCEDCIHYDICLGAFGDWLPKTCDSFKDKSKFIALPCSPGDYCIWKEAEWHVNSVDWTGEYFVLWISDARRQSPDRSVLACEVRFMTEREVDKMFGQINAERKKYWEELK